MLCYEIRARVRREGWSQSLVRAVAGLYRPRLEVRKSFDLSHPLGGDRSVSENVIHASVEYPSPHAALTISDDLLRYAVQQFRANLELAISLEAEVAGNCLLNFETSRADDGTVLSEASYGLTGPIIMLQNLMARLAAHDPQAARTEIAGWPTDDEQVFARLRIWAAGQTLSSPGEAAEIFLGLPDIVFWDRSTSATSSMLCVIAGAIWARRTGRHWSIGSVRVPIRGATKCRADRAMRVPSIA